MKRSFANCKAVKLFEFCVVLLLIHFSQVYPHTHFHDFVEPPEATEGVSEIVVHITSDQQPLDREHDQSPFDNRPEHDQHHEYTQHIDWHLVRLHSNSVNATFGVPSLQSSWSSFAESLVEEKHYSPDTIPLSLEFLVGD